MAEKEFIEREALLKSDNWQSLTSDFDKAKAHIIILGQPAADVIEVVHGEWISEFGSYCTPRCSACGWHKPYTEDYYCAQELYQNWNYCPNCGAKMDGERKSEDA